MTTFLPQLPENNQFLLIGVKIMFVLAGFLYLLFALLITKQVSLMSKTLGTTHAARNKFLAFIHLIISIGVLIYYLLVL
ncbi:hypothetical protein KA111_02185 [Candidatus Woesebacteria bacterium]|nr:hypothetical protein [Candidatus Woesebacteria bacterium]